MKKTLIIHPEDPSTTFLETIYKDIENKTVITGGLTKREVNILIENHDRVMMMGHGSPGGLFSVGKFQTNNGYVVDYSTVRLLEEKEDNVFIWCYANEYVLRYGLKGFFTGMFISETSEAYACGVRTATQEDVDISNNTFCEIVSKNINESTEVLYENVLNEYGVLAQTNDVAEYNHYLINKFKTN